MSEEELFSVRLPIPPRISTAGLEPAQPSGTGSLSEVTPSSASQNMIFWWAKMDSNHRRS